MIASVKPHVGDAGAVAHKQDVADTQIGNKPYSPPTERKAGRRDNGHTRALYNLYAWLLESSPRPSRRSEREERVEGERPKYGPSLMGF